MPGLIEAARARSDRPANKRAWDGWNPKIGVANATNRCSFPAGSRSSNSRRRGLRPVRESLCDPSAPRRCASPHKSEDAPDSDAEPGRADCHSLAGSQRRSNGYAHSNTKLVSSQRSRFRRTRRIPGNRSSHRAATATRMPESGPDAETRTFSSWTRSSISYIGNHRNRPRPFLNSSADCRGTAIG